MQCGLAGFGSFDPKPRSFEPHLKLMSLSVHLAFKAQPLQSEILSYESKTPPPHPSLHLVKLPAVDSQRLPLQLELLLPCLLCSNKLYAKGLN